MRDLFLTRHYRNFLLRCLALWVAVLTAGCSGDLLEPDPQPMPEPEPQLDAGFDVDTRPPDGGVRPELSLVVERAYPNGAPVAQTPSCAWASPLRYQRGDATEIVVAAGELIAGHDAESGARLWEVVLPATFQEMAYVTSTPLMIGDLLVVAYHTTDRTEEPRDVNNRRLAQRVAVIDLAARDIAPEFDVLDLSASLPASVGGGSVDFLPAHTLNRSDITRGLEPDDVLGRAYVAYGNARDIQPWHGWAFEIDLDAWRESEDGAVSGIFVVTPESDCGAVGHSGSRERLCGGGLWAPSGQLIIQKDDGYSVILGAGNGQLDLARRDYANTLMKVGPGLDFDPGCDPEACADFNPDEPAEACAASCDALFIPRMPDGAAYPVPEDGVCDGLSMYECWEKKDYIGGSTPVHITLEGYELLAYPTKDGALYLVDANQLGTLYDRIQLVAICGTADDRCQLDWAGMIVTQPSLTEVDGDPVVITPTFQPDNTHPAGVVAVKVVLEDGVPRLTPWWQYPRFDTVEAIERFRRHPGRITLARYGEEQVEVAWLVEVYRGGKGRLIGIRTADGEVLVDHVMYGPGTRYSVPVVYEDRVIVSSCTSDFGPSWLEAYRVALR